MAPLWPTMQTVSHHDFQQIHLSWTEDHWGSHFRGHLLSHMSRAQAYCCWLQTMQRIMQEAHGVGFIRWISTLLQHRTSLLWAGKPSGVKYASGTQGPLSCEHTQQWLFLDFPVPQRHQQTCSLQDFSPTTGLEHRP